MSIKEDWEKHLKNRYQMMADATQWERLRELTVLYCESIDRFYEIYGKQPLPDNWDNRRKRKESA